MVRYNSGMNRDNLYESPENTAKRNSKKLHMQPV
jgi:hypothetical protein